MTSDTPRTDAEWASTWQTERRLHELCLQLERELAISLENQLKTQAEVERLKGFLHRSLQLSEGFRVALSGVTGGEVTCTHREKLMREISTLYPKTTTNK